MVAAFIAGLASPCCLGNALAWILWLYILNSFSAGTAGLGMLLTPVIGISRPGYSWGSGPASSRAWACRDRRRAAADRGRRDPQRKKIAVTIRNIGISTAIE